MENKNIPPVVEENKISQCCSDKKITIFKIATIVIGILIVVGLFLNAYLFLTKKESKVNPEQPITTTPTLDPTTDWLAFQNTEMGFELLHPTEWKSDLSDTSSGTYISFTSTRDEMYFISSFNVDLLKDQKLALRRFKATQYLEVGQTKSIEDSCRKKIADLEIDNYPAVEYSVDYASIACPVDPEFENPEIIVRTPKVVEINKDNKIYTLSLVVSNGEDPAKDSEKITIFDQILSTFKFD